MKGKQQLTLTVTLAILLSISVDAAHALTISVSGQGLTAASAAETTFLGGLSSVVTESFEGFTAANPSVKPLSFATSVGTFTQIVPGHGGACEPTTCAGLSVLSSSTTPFSGRFATAGANWLDSNDSMNMQWTSVPGGLNTSVGFYITDPNDQGARMDIRGVSGDMVSVNFDNIFGGSLRNGRVFYVSVDDPHGIANLNFLADDNADGYGIDKFSVGSPVPEPTTLLLLGTGLVGLAARGRFRNG
ncbi:MAG: PEP-CTERM sorting domain-containing protein [Nitrospiraceae bacterium]